MKGEGVGGWMIKVKRLRKKQLTQITVWCYQRERVEGGDRRGKGRINGEGRRFDLWW